MRTGRRAFLATAAAGTALAACGGCASTTPPGPRTHALPEAPRPPDESTVAVVRVDAFRTLRDAVVQAIRLAGGLAFVRPGDRVLLKPAVNSARPYPATTDPEVVAIVAALVRDAGGQAFVADRTMFLRSTWSAFERTGILGAARDAGIPCIALDEEPVVAIVHPLATHWTSRTIRVYRTAAEADHVIDLCTPRTHRLAGFTMAMKNCVGVVGGAARLGMHLGSGFRERLAEISAAFRPSLAVLDGRMGFADGGPDEGDLVRPGFVAASTDPLALDVVGVAHLRLAGTNDAIGRGSVWRIPVIRRAAEIGVGATEAGRIRIVGLPPELEARIRGELG
ncbi:DUF362 domain-containing protein [Anaeromyxobacter oryzae]|uniref:DUF362 domain-containing protein n=1 Tax=Anaeromyxobacter oryzae TaxID=2918170 RepID=A0ABM7X061_9BACT|nr:DUF362 domain-containing protein [Anaeromyxobacter oryzae]BDG05174.1 hypothetical protein AMOR_41700 [Anaeromyxobacter oryzae]